jgi:hypothetical protein
VAQLMRESGGKPPHSKSAGARAALVEFVLGDFTAQGVAVNAQNFGGTGLVTVGPLQYALDETFFKLAYGLIKEDAAFHHQRYQAFQLISHGRSSSGKMRFSCMA